MTGFAKLWSRPLMCSASIDWCVPFLSVSTVIVVYRFGLQFAHLLVARISAEVSHPVRALL